MSQPSFLGFLLTSFLCSALPAAGQARLADTDLILDHARNGDRALAAGLWDDLDSSRQRNQLAEHFANAVVGGQDQGGGALADFDTLMNLITSTIEPESWDANGGVGTLQGFPAGVYVDADHCLRRTSPPTAARLRTSLQRALAAKGPTQNTMPASPPSAEAGARRIAGSGSKTADGQDDASRPLRKVSLPRLERYWLRQVLSGDPIPAEVYRLAGLQRVEYVAIHEETGDVILAGPADDQGHCLSLDCWLQVFFNALRGEHRFGCSIEPRPENLAAAQRFIQQSSGRPISPARRDAWSHGLRDRLGRQQIHVQGIDPHSHAAKIIVAADYHMKLIGIGLESGEPLVPSYLSMVQPGPDGQPPAMDVLRWWFTLDYERLECDEERRVFRLVGRGARVQCENEFLDERGGRVHSGTAEPANRQFAAQFTRHLGELRQRYPVYQQLQGLFDLSLAAAIIREYGLAERVGWEPLVLHLPAAPSVDSSPLAKEVETVVKVRELNRRIFITAVSGGVDVDPTPFVKQPAATTYPLEDAYDGMAPETAYEAERRWWWD